MPIDWKEKELTVEGKQFLSTKHSRFRTKREAKEYAERLRRVGYKARVVEETGWDYANRETSYAVYSRAT